MQKSTRLVVAAGLGLTLGALAFILLGDGIIYLANLFGAPSGASLGSSLVDTGYAIIVLLLLVFISVVAYLVYRRNQSDPYGWSGY